MKVAIHYNPKMINLLQVMMMTTMMMMFKDDTLSVTVTHLSSWRAISWKMIYF